MYTNTIIKFGFRMISCIFKPRVWVTCLSLRLRLITHISFRQFMISTQLHPIHIELLITTFTISQTGRRCATQLGEGEGSSQCPGEETEKVWSGWFSLELLARCLTPFPPLAGNCKNTDLGGRRRINDGVNYKKKFEIGKKSAKKRWS